MILSNNWEINTLLPLSNIHLIDFSLESELVWFFFSIIYIMNIRAKMRILKTKHELFTAAQSCMTSWNISNSPKFCTTTWDQLSIHNTWFYKHKSACKKQYDCIYVRKKYFFSLWTLGIKWWFLDTTLVEGKQSTCSWDITLTSVMFHNNCERKILCAMLTFW